MRFTAEIFDDDLDSEVEKTSDKTPEWLTKAQNASLNFANYFQVHTPSLSCKPRKCRWRMRRHKSQSHRIHDVTQKFSHLNLLDTPLQDKHSVSIVPKVQLTSNSGNPKMEKNSASSSTVNYPNETPSAWLQQYLLNMKREIKKEIMDELLSSHEFEKYAPIPGVPKESDGLYQGKIIHYGIFCDNCDQVIHGIRYKCGNCSDFDLCQECESLPNVHNKNHIFLKVRTPIALMGYQRQKWQELMQPSCSQLYSNRQAKKLYAAKFISDETIPDGTIVPPLTKFVKYWKIANGGTRVWTHSTRLQFIQGSPGLVSGSEYVSVPHLMPGEEGVVSMQFTSPAAEGVYRSHWNFWHRNRPFGDIIWCHIIVKADDKSSQLPEPTPESLFDSGIKIEPNKQATVSTEKKQDDMSCVAQVLAAVQEQEANTMVPRKLAVTSHTATPTNTPFDLTPPKSPDHHETAMKEIQELAPENNSKITITLHESDHDDECSSIVSVSSTESDAEFVIVPMPKCFEFDQIFTLNNSNLPQEIEKDQIKKATDAQISKPEVPKVLSIHKTISQETGVPELLENDQQAVIIQGGSANQQPISVVSDLSSEISIIDSGGSSPVSDDIPHDGTSINVTISPDGSSSIQIAQQCEQSVQVKIGNEEAPSSITFPKFPVEGVTSVFDPTPSCNEERSIPMLPEGLMNGALSAAATVYNTACDIITNIQHPQEKTQIAENQLILMEMGFCNQALNEKLLKKHKGELSLVIDELVNMDDNNWHASRHNCATPPPPFD